jgi:hypothetical protein
MIDWVEVWGVTVLVTSVPIGWMLADLLYFKPKMKRAVLCERSENKGYVEVSTGIPGASKYPLTPPPPLTDQHLLEPPRDSSGVDVVSWGGGVVRTIDDTNAAVRYLTGHRPSVILTTPESRTGKEIE